MTGTTLLGTADADAMLSEVRKRGRGRPPGRSRAPGRSRGLSNPGTNGTRGASTRGRGRGGVERSGAKRKRSSSSTSSGGSSPSRAPADRPIVTKSGRVTSKPTAYVPSAATDVLTSGGRPRRSYRRGPEHARCAKCARGHSPASNMIVFCDACEGAWHQWCHDPHIARAVIDVPELAWFCGACRRGREVESLSAVERVHGLRLSMDEVCAACLLPPNLQWRDGVAEAFADGNLADSSPHVQKRTYLTNLSSGTLIDLLLHATTLHPSLPIFAPDAHAVLASLHEPLRTQPTALLAPGPDSTLTQTHADADADSRSDPYPDYAADPSEPPGTYPRPGHGPHKPRPTTDPADLPWLLDDAFEGFEHLVNDGHGNFVPAGPFGTDKRAADGQGQPNGTGSGSAGGTSTEAATMRISDAVGRPTPAM